MRAFARPRSQNGIHRAGIGVGARRHGGTRTRPCSDAGIAALTLVERPVAARGRAVAVTRIGRAYGTTAVTGSRGADFCVSTLGKTGSRLHRRIGRAAVGIVAVGGARRTREVRSTDGRVTLLAGFDGPVPTRWFAIRVVDAACPPLAATVAVHRCRNSRSRQFGTGWPKARHWCMDLVVARGRARALRARGDGRVAGFSRSARPLPHAACTSRGNPAYRALSRHLTLPSPHVEVAPGRRHPDRREKRDNGQPANAKPLPDQDMQQISIATPQRSRPSNLQARTRSASSRARSVRRQRSTVRNRHDAVVVVANKRSICAPSPLARRAELGHVRAACRATTDPRAAK